MDDLDLPAPPVSRRAKKLEPRTLPLKAVTISLHCWKIGFLGVLAWALVNFINYRLKAPEIEAKLSRDTEFWNFCVANYRSRDLNRKLLQFCLPKSEFFKVKFMKPTTVLETICLATCETKYRDLSLEEAISKDFSSTIARVAPPHKHALVGIEPTVVDFLKSCFVSHNKTWGLPKLLFDRLRVDAPCGAHLVAPPLLDVQSFYKTIADLEPEATDITSMVFFAVRIARPEHLKIVGSRDRVRSSSLCVVEILKPLHQTAEEGGICLTGSAEIVSIDLRRMASPEGLSSLKLWTNVEHRTAGQLNDAATQALADSADLLAAEPCPMDGDILAMQNSGPDVLYAIVRTTILRCMQGEPCSQLDLRFAVPGSNVNDFHRLVLAGILKVKDVGFGEEEYEAAPHCLGPSAQVRYILSGEVSPLTHSFPNAETSDSKLILFLECVRRGWEPVDPPLRPYEIGHPKQFEVTMVSKSNLYFRSLLRADAILAKGTHLIYHGLPLGYYQVLLTLSDLRGFHERGYCSGCRSRGSCCPASPSA
eukprot:TRINITY_DN2376_c0_g1_i1.p1 TRINITY_DN2376_c0_g1~~TRINITY_DN2376_c0_g1_i1.p1  ORF type:complete len:535 (-),score=55.38 TRINITY_DN2376_c0_g1_i1:511-2115(-)